MTDAPQPSSRGAAGPPAGPGVRRAVIAAAAGIVGPVVLWEVLARTPALAGVLPPLTDIVRTVFFSDDRGLFANALLFTVKNAALGYLLGAAIGMALAVVALLVAALRPGIVRLAAVANAVPVVAFGPVLLATVERNGLPIAVAAFFVFFSVFVATLTGFSEASAAHRDVFAALGADRRKRLLYLEWPASLPTLVSGLKVAAPAAVVGSIFGEWFGLDRGIGPLLVTSMQTYDIAALWGATLLAGSFSFLLFVLFSVIETMTIARFR